MAPFFRLLVLLSALMQAVLSEYGNYFHILKTCQFEGSGSQVDVRYRIQYHYNGRLIAQYNSSSETVAGFTPYGRIFAEEVNGNAQYLLHRRNDLDYYCKVKGVMLYQAARQKTVAPFVNLKMVQAKAPDSTVLVCSIHNFYPRDIRVTWLKNGKPFLQAEPQGSPWLSGPANRSGPWRYQLISHLKYTPVMGETISCVVEHASLDEPKVYHLDLSVVWTDQLMVILGSSLLILGAVALLTGGGCYWNATRDKHGVWTLAQDSVNDD